MSKRTRLELLSRRLQASTTALALDETWAEKLILSVLELEDAVIDGDWRAIRRTSQQCLGNGIAAHSDLTYRAFDRASRVPNVVAALVDLVLRGVAASPDRGPLVDRLRTSLPSDDEAAAARLGAVLDAVAEGTAAGNAAFTALVRRRPGVLGLPGSHYALASLTRGLLGTIHSEFNAAWEYWESRTDSLLSPDLVPTLGSLINVFDQEQIRKVTKLQACLVGDLDRAETSAAIRDLWHSVGMSAPRLGRALSAGHRAAAAYRDRGSGEQAEEVGSMLAEGGGLIRQSVASAIAGQQLALDVALNESGAPIPLAALARQLPLGDGLRNGRNVDLEDIGELDDDDLVEVRAFVDKVEAVRDADGKLMSIVTVADPSSGASAKATANFVDFRHRGMTPGSFCRFSATVERSNQAGEAVALRIDRLSAAEWSGVQWRFALMDSARRWFQPFPNGHNIVWSLGPHHAASVTEDSDRMGAGELVFLELG